MSGEGALRTIPADGMSTGNSDVGYLGACLRGQNRLKFAAQLLVVRLSLTRSCHARSMAVPSAYSSATVALVNPRTAVRSFHVQL